MTAHWILFPELSWPNLRINQGGMSHNVHLSWILLISHVIVVFVTEGNLPIKLTFGNQSGAPVNHCVWQPFFSTNCQIPQWSQIIFISQLFRVFAFVCLARQMGTLLVFGTNSLDDIMPGMPNQSQKNDLEVFNHPALFYQPAFPWLLKSAVRICSFRQLSGLLAHTWPICSPS